MENGGNPKRFGSLSTSLTLAFLVVSTVILLGVVGLETLFQYRAQANAVSAQQQTIARNAADAVEGFVKDKFSVLAITANLSNFAAANQQDQKLILGRLLGAVSAFRQLATFDEQGAEKTRVSRLSSFEPSQLEKALEDHLAAVAQGGLNYVSPVYIDDNTNEPLTAIMIPLKDVYGDYRGALAAEVNLKFMWDLMNSIRVGVAGQAYVVDEKGYLIAYDDIGRVLAVENLSGVAEVSRFINGRKSVDAVVSKGINGTQVVTSHVALGSPTWAVVLELPLGEAYKPLLDSVRASILIVLFGLALVIFVSIRLSAVITKPLTQLRDAALAISRGDWQSKIEVPAKNEIGELASVFNEMTAKLRESYAGLEQKVAERTEELEASKRQLETSVSEMKRMNGLMVGREIKMAELKMEIDRLREKLGPTPPDQAS